MGNKANYKAQVIEASKELTGKEKVAVKNFADMIQIDEATKETDAGLLINIAWKHRFLCIMRKLITRIT